MSFKFATRLAALVVVSLLIRPVWASSFWFADDEKLYQFNSSTNTVDRSIELEGIRALATTSDGSVWVSSKKRLALIRPTGAVAVDVSSKSLLLSEIGQIALNTRDGSLWLAEEKDDDGEESERSIARRIVRVDANGAPVQEFSISSKVRGLTAGLDQTLWVLGEGQLWHFSASGALIAHVSLDQQIKANPSLIAVDSIGAWSWMADEKQIWRLGNANQNPSVIRITLEKEVKAISLDPKSGVIWALVDSAILAYGRDGGLRQSISLKMLGAKEPKLVAFDSSNSSVWVTYKNSVARISLDGSRIATLPLKEDANAISVAPATVVPTIEILAPTNERVTTNSLPIFQLGLGASCGATSCGFGVDYFQTYRLSATLNGEQVGSQFTFRPDLPLAVFMPTNHLPEGVNTFSAFVTDSFGQLSSTATANFLVDTLPPSISSLSPPNGALLSDPFLAITGTLSEPAYIRLAGNSSLSGTTGVTFRFPVTLMEGLNQFTLTAKDAAGNESEHLLSFTLDTTPPRLADMITDFGVLVESPTFTVTGSSDEAATFTLSKSGVSQTAQGKSFSFTVKLEWGLNVFNLVATDSAGNSTAKEVRVTRQDPGITAALSMPSPGSIYSTPAAIRVVAEVFSQDSEIQRVEFLKDGELVANVNTQPFEHQLVLSSPGSFDLSVIAYSDSGAIAKSGDVRVHVFDTPERATRAVWDRFRAAIIGGNPAGAVSHLAGATKVR